MTRIYGHKWTSIAESDDGTWLAGLQDFTPELIAVGLGNLLMAGTEWPPSLPEFRDYCLDKKDDEGWRYNTAAYKEVKRQVALPHLKSDKGTAKKHIEEMKEKLGIKKF